MSTSLIPRSIDHLVLPVTHIDIARSRYEQLGFVVAPDGVHPSGTENCCIFLADGTFLEPLGIAHRETCEDAALRGHTFAQNDQTYRFRRGDEGFSHLVIKTDDASADHKAWQKAAMSAGKMVRFTRKLINSEGKSDKVSFKLAFASDKRAPDAGFFSCEVVRKANVDRSGLISHENGVIGLKEVIMAEPNPSDFQYFLQDFLNQRLMDNHSFGIELKTGNAKVSVLSPAGLRAFYGEEAEPKERGLRMMGFVLAVSSLTKVGNLLDKAGIEIREIGKRLIVPPAKGQGAFIAFEE